MLEQLEKLTAALGKVAKKDLEGYHSSANAKLLTAMRKLIFETIPVDPTRLEYRQGGTLGANRKHWSRAKFGGGRFHLFLRYSSSAKIIIFAWANDTQTLRSYGSKSDAYTVFMATPSEDWAALVAGSSALPCD